MAGYTLKLSFYCSHNEQHVLNDLFAQCLDVLYGVDELTFHTMIIELLVESGVH